MGLIDRLLGRKKPVPYVCEICEAEFDTPQALGGHMTGHSRRGETK